ncbi:MAG TPA: hypothetical protein VL171_12625 [Verrucomicrobiae bacterium]|nr:hypothetical protein [Verrucomicrobiae bacterium]
MKILSILSATILVWNLGCSGTHQRLDAWEYKVIQRYDYPGLNNTNHLEYAFSWQTQLHIYEQQGWSIDSVAFTTNNFGKAALITLKHAKK